MDFDSVRTTNRITLEHIARLTEHGFSYMIIQLNGEYEYSRRSWPRMRFTIAYNGEEAFEIIYDEFNEDALFLKKVETYLGIGNQQEQPFMEQYLKAEDLVKERIRSVDQLDERIALNIIEKAIEETVGSLPTELVIDGPFHLPRSREIEGKAVPPTGRVLRAAVRCMMSNL